MKPEKPIASFPPSSRSLPKTEGLEELRALQRLLFSSLTRPLDPAEPVPSQTGQGENLAALAARLIRPSAKLSSFDRLEIYHRQYWLRLWEAFSEDFPALENLLGPDRFREVVQAYLLRYPPTSPLLRELGIRLPRFLREEPTWAQPLPHRLVVDLARFEWAKIVAFYAPEHPLPRPDEIATRQTRLFLQPHLCLLVLRYPVERGKPEDFSPAAPPPPEPRRLVVHRQGETVYHKLLSRDAFFLLGSFGKGLSLPEACFRTAQRFPDLPPENYEEWFRNWSSLGWLTTRAAERT